MPDASVIESNLNWVRECWSHLRRGYEGDPERVEIFGLEAVLRLLNEEFAFNRLQNKTFRKTISGSCKAAVAFLKEHALHSELALLLSQIEKLALEGDSMRLRANTRDAIAICDSGEYIVALIGRLKAVVTAGPLVPDNARKLLNEIFSAFLLRDYSTAEVEAIIPNAFFETASEVNGGFHTSFIDVPNADKYLSLHPPNLRAWNEYQRTFVENLSLDDRFDAIVRYYLKPLRPLKVIAQLQGLKFMKPLSVGEFELYPPQQRHIVSGPFGLSDELFLGGPTADDRVNVMLTVQGRSPESTTDRAFELFRSLTDVLNMTWNPRMRIRLIETSAHVVDVDGSLLRSSNKSDDQHENLYKHFSIAGDAYVQHDSWAVIERAVRSILSEDSIANRRYTTALRAYVRAKGASPDQAILNYWIVIDSLLAVADLPGILGVSADRTESVAQVFLPAAIALHSLSGVGWDLFNDLRYAWTNRRFAYREIMANVPQELAQQSGIEVVPFARIDLGDLVSRLDRWHGVLPASYLRDRIDDVKTFYDDAKKRKASIYQLHRRAEDEVTIFYQLRNRVVHHADKSSDMFRVFVDRARTYASLILSYAIAEDIADLRESAALTINAWEPLKQRMASDETFDPLDFDGLIRRRLLKDAVPNTAP